MSNPHGMLFVATNVAPEDEADFNQWYDHEHVEERVAIEGFLSGTRYRAVAAARRYLGLYETASQETFTSAAYHAAFTRQTEWSVANLNRMIDPMRRVCAVTHRHGRGQGAHLAMLTLHAGPDGAALQAWQQHLQQVPGYISSCLLTPDVSLSTPLPRETHAHRPMQSMLLLHCADETACIALADRAAQAFHADAERYALSWQLTRQEISYE
nr:DUF4286 family protein [uncultured Pantoea sp.]